jgi:hypothetical protein
MADGERYLVELRAEGAGPPAAIRLRRWLKACLRSYGLRCVSVEEVRTPAQAGPPGPPEPETRPEAQPSGQNAADEPRGPAKRRRSRR